MSKGISSILCLHKSRHQSLCRSLSRLVPVEGANPSISLCVFRRQIWCHLKLNSPQVINRLEEGLMESACHFSSSSLSLLLNCRCVSNCLYSKRMSFEWGYSSGYLSIGHTERERIVHLLHQRKNAHDRLARCRSDDAPLIASDMQKRQEIA